MKYLSIQLCRHNKCLVIIGVVMNLCMAMMYLQDDGIGDRIVLYFLFKCTQMDLKERIKYPNRYDMVFWLFKPRHMQMCLCLSQEQWESI